MSASRALRPGEWHCWNEPGGPWVAVAAAEGAVFEGRGSTRLEAMGAAIDRMIDAGLEIVGRPPAAGNFRPADAMAAERRHPHLESREFGQQQVHDERSRLAVEAIGRLERSLLELGAQQIQGCPDEVVAYAIHLAEKGAAATRGATLATPADFAEELAAARHGTTAVTDSASRSITALDEVCKRDGVGWRAERMAAQSVSYAWVFGLDKEKETQILARAIGQVLATVLETLLERYAATLIKAEDAVLAPDPHLVAQPEGELGEPGKGPADG